MLGRAAADREVNQSDMETDLVQYLDSVIASVGYEAVGGRPCRRRSGR